MPFTKQNTPVWIIFLGDIFLSFLAIWAAFLLRFNFNIPHAEVKTLPMVMSLVLVSRALSALIFQTHRGIVRFTNTKDVERIFISVAIVSALFLLVNPVMFWLKGIYLIPYSIIIMEGILCVFLMVSARMVIKALINEVSNSRKEKFKLQDKLGL
jgi:FlaA1/EpsC-like NDP-sugar epimerase